MLPTASLSAPGRNSYDYRLVVSRKLYDRAVGTQMAHSMANLAPGSAAHINPLDLDGLGVAAGDDVKIAEREGGERPARRGQHERATRGRVVTLQPGQQHDRGHHRRSTGDHRREDRAGLMMFGLDPLLEGGLLWTPLLIVLLKVVVIFVLGLVSTMLMIWYERKVVSGMHNRIGPNKAGPWGILQTLADGIKAFFLGDLLPTQRPDRVPTRPVPGLRPGIPGVVDHPVGR